MTTEEAISAIISHETMPPQIDYISPAMKKKYNDAVAHIDALPEPEQKVAREKLVGSIEEYYESGAAHFDSLF